MRRIAPQVDWDSQAATRDLNRWLETCSAEERVEWALESLPCIHALTSSFGAQAAVSLHLVTQQRPNIPVILIDTGYLFPETYRFIDGLVEQLGLNLRVFRSDLSPAWQEARWGQRWLQGVDGIEAYNHVNKVEPMSRALEELGVGTWFAGLRRAQGKSRNGLEVAVRSNGAWKVHPIVDWHDEQVVDYMKQHNLPYHPLWEQGYVSIGDIHTTKPLTEGASAESTRFFGLKRECGLHEMDFGKRRSA